ncbi:MAG: ATP-binding cassette domain-containing protein, partial [Alphaproteobacteria bacterium]|nr:ATP-binding cassette domain-containing protein [Alphaproteobacteria bacterium]
FLGGGSVVIHGYLLWIAIIYAGIGTWVIFKIGRPLIGLSYRTEAAEAGLRYSLIRLREQGEGVALYHGEKAEQTGLQSRLAEVITMMRQVLHRRKIIIGVRSTYGQIATIFPFLVIAPRYFSKEITLGTMTQTAGAFGSVQDSLSVLIDSYTAIAGWQATIERLHDFNLGLRDAEAAAGSYREQQHRSIAAAGSPLVLELSDLEIFLPDGRLVQTVPNLRLSRGDSLLITGSSGSGKTTLLRVLSGVWPYWRGRIVMGGEVSERLFLPQRPYLPEGSLAAALAYPRPLELLTAEQQAEFAVVLELTGLAGLVPRLAELGQWSQSLSPGEQQRLAVARLLLLRPGLAFLDEATSALDEAMETRLYEQIRQTLPEVSLVSVGHRASLTRFHNQNLHIVPTLGNIQSP